MSSPARDRLKRVDECLLALSLPAMTAEEEKAYRAKVAKVYAQDYPPEQGGLFKGEA